MSTLIDGYGRVHRDLRVSLTDRCSLRCTYCLPEEFTGWVPGDHLLTVDEIVRVVEIACANGIESVRLTGGEPLLHPAVVEIVARINALPNAPEISITTNGLRLADLAGDLAEAGLHRVNVSLDTLRPDRFQTITRRDRFTDVIAGIDAARAAGLHPIKLNAVPLRGVNDDEFSDLLAFAIDRGLHMRFIEQMPLDAGHVWSRDALVTAAEVESALRRDFELEPVPQRGSSPAEEFFVNGGPHRVGIIASVTRPFCGACDRMRLTADGQIRNCLFARHEHDLRAILRDDRLATDEVATRIGAVLATAIGSKKAGHGIDDPGFVQPERPMSAIGG